MPNSIAWVVVANSSHAKFFRINKFPKMEALSTLDHPKSRLHDMDLVTSKPGRGFDSLGTGRHAYQTAVDPKHHEIEKFARELSKYLDTASLNKEFSRLYLIASPAFLGLLRQYMDSQTQNIIVAEIAKDMTEHTTSDIEGQLARI